MNKILLLFVLLFLSISQTNSQITKGLPETFSLEKCLEIATKNNIEIQISEARVNSSTAELTAAFGSFLPTINFNMGYNRQLNTEGPSTVNIGGQIITIPPTSPNSYQMGAFASYPIFNGFSREANYNRAQDYLNYTYLNYQQTIQKVHLDIYRQYIDVIRKQQIVKIRNQDLILGQKELERIKAQYEAGYIHIGIVYTQESEMGNRELNLLSAENDLRIAESVLLNTMGLNPEMDADFLESSLPNDLTEQTIQKFRYEIGTFDNAKKIALDNRLDFAATKSSVSAAQSSITMAESGYYPKLSASGGWSWTNSEFTKFSELGRSYIGLSLNIPVFENFNTNNQIQSAKMNLTQAQLEQVQAERTISSSIQSSLLILEAAEKQIDITNRTLKATQRNFETISERFKIGASNITEVLDANTRLITAQINRINAIYGYFQAQKEVLFALGKL